MLEHFSNRPPLRLRFRLTSIARHVLDSTTQALVLLVEMLQ
jgi:hypothetical protein